MIIIIIGLIFINFLQIIFIRHKFSIRVTELNLNRSTYTKYHYKLVKFYLNSSVIQLIQWFKESVQWFF